MKGLFDFEHDPIQSLIAKQIQKKTMRAIPMKISIMLWAKRCS